jgi:RDD family
MKCPACKYVCSDLRDLCPKCYLDLRAEKKALGITIINPNANYNELLQKTIKPSTTETTASPKKSPKKNTGPGLFAKFKSFTKDILSSKSKNKDSVETAILETTLTPEITTTHETTHTVAIHDQRTMQDQNPEQESPIIDSPINLETTQAINSIEETLVGLSNEDLVIQDEPESFSSDEEAKSDLLFIGDDLPQAPEIETIETSIQVEEPSNIEEEPVLEHQETSTTQNEVAEIASTSLETLPETLPESPLETPSENTENPDYTEQMSMLIEQSIAAEESNNQEASFENDKEGEISELPTEVYEIDADETELNLIANELFESEVLQNQPLSEVAPITPQELIDHAQAAEISPQYEAANLDGQISNDYSQNQYSENLIESIMSYPSNSYSETEEESTEEQSHSPVDDSSLETLFQDCIDNLQTKDDFEISLEQFYQPTNDSEVQMLFDIVQESIDNPTYVDTLTKEIITSEKRQVESEKLKEVISETEGALSQSVVSLKNQSGNELDKLRKALGKDARDVYGTNQKKYQAVTTMRRFTCSAIDTLASLAIGLVITTLLSYSVFPEIGKSINNISHIGFYEMLPIVTLLIVSSIFSILMYPIAALIFLHNSLGTKLTQIKVLGADFKRAKTINLILRATLLPLSVMTFTVLAPLFGKRSLHETVSRTYLYI